MPIATLAINGGNPVCVDPWPVWPQCTPATLAHVERALTSGRWTISGPYRGKPSFDQQAARAFARTCETDHCVLTASGTGGLYVALEACGVGAGDDVVVPGLTWVACASAVLGVNAVPVLADVDPDTLCVTPASIEAAITDRTRAISVVHLYSGLADMEPIMALARERGLAVIEDSSQAHGARYADRPVGSLGDVGVFSLQGSKLLTCGEGGAIVTSDARLARRAEHLRADGRTVARHPVQPGEMELLETAEVMGGNVCLSELQAAVLLAQLDELEAQNARRRQAADHLSPLLAELGCQPQATAPATTARSYYRYAVRLPEPLTDRVPADRVAEALGAELGFPVTPTYQPLGASRLYRPGTRRRFATGPDFLERVERGRTPLPAATAAHCRTVTFGHEVLLADPQRMGTIAAAFAKVLDGVDTLGAGDAPRAPTSDGHLRRKLGDFQATTSPVETEDPVLPPLHLI